MSSPTYSTLEPSDKGGGTPDVETTTVAYVLASSCCCFSATSLFTRGEVLPALTTLPLLSSPSRVSLCGISSGGYFLLSVL